MPSIKRISPVGGLPTLYPRDAYSHQSTLVTATINSAEWIPPGGSVTIIGPHDQGIVYSNFGIDANGCGKNSLIRLYRNETLLSSLSVGQCGDTLSGNLCADLRTIPASISGGIYTIRFIETNCGSRVYSSAYRHIWIPTKYPPRSRIAQANPVGTGPTYDGVSTT